MFVITTLSIKQTPGLYLTQILKPVVTSQNPSFRLTHKPRFTSKTGQVKTLTSILPILLPNELESTNHRIHNVPVHILNLDKEVP